MGYTIWRGMYLSGVGIGMIGHTTVHRPGLTRAGRLPSLVATVFCAAAFGTAPRTMGSAPFVAAAARPLPTTAVGFVV